MTLNDQIKQTVKKATQENLAMDDWDSIILLCDLLSQKPDESSSVVISAVIDRLQTGNPKVQRLTLTLLDSCVKNAGDYFHREMCLPKNLAVVEKLASSGEVGAQVKEFVSEWAREHGVRMTEFQHSLARINGDEPPLKVEPPRPSEGIERTDNIGRNQQQQQRPEERSSQNVKMKLRADVEVVRDTIQILREMVNAAETVEDVKTGSCIQVIVNCREMHKRLITLIESEPEEDLLLELIDLNDELYAAIEEHDHFKRTGTKKNAKEQHKASNKGKSSLVESTKEGDLLDTFMNENEGSATQTAGASSSSSQPITDLDAFLFASAPPPPPPNSSAQSKSFDTQEQQSQNKKQMQHPLEDPFADLVISSPPQQQQQQQKTSQEGNENLYPSF